MQSAGLVVGLGNCTAEDDGVPLVESDPLLVGEVVALSGPGDDVSEGADSRSG
jgi:hypothetical protein